MMTTFQRKRLQLNCKFSFSIQILIEGFTRHKLSSPHKQEIQKINESNVHVIPNPTKRSQKVVCCYVTSSYMLKTYNLSWVH